MPAEWALILSGTLIFGAVYYIIQKIKKALQFLEW
jgi:hypothetical protein